MKSRPLRHLDWSSAVFASAYIWSKWNRQFRLKSIGLRLQGSQVYLKLDVEHISKLGGDFQKFREMTIGEDFTEPLINGEINSSVITSSVFVVTENHIAVTRPLCDGHGNNPIANDPSKIGFSKWVWGEVREQCWLSGPIVAMYFMQFLMSIVGVMYIGHLGALPLAAVSLANSFGGITGFTVLVRAISCPSLRWRWLAVNGTTDSFSWLLMGSLSKFQIGFCGPGVQCWGCLIPVCFSVF